MDAADVSAVQAIGVDAGERFRAHEDPRIAACADHEPWAAADLAPFVDEQRAWVATDDADGAVVGYVLVEQLDGAAHVEEVSVSRTAGGRGVATALLATVDDWAAARSLPAVTLTTFRDVAWNRPFYERRGFVVVDEPDRTTAMRARVDREERAFGLPAELRVVMRRPVALVREAVATDLPAIRSLFNALIPTTTVAWRDEEASEDEMATWFADQCTAGNPVLVAALDGAVVGYVTWVWFRGGARFRGYRHTRELTIHVDGRVHGRGVGRRLLSALVARAQAEDVHVLVAGVDADNVASIGFHRRLGFVEVARMPEVGRKFGRWLDLVLLERIVAEA